MVSYSCEVPCKTYHIEILQLYFRKEDFQPPPSVICPLQNSPSASCCAITLASFALSCLLFRFSLLSTSVLVVVHTDCHLFVLTCFVNLHLLSVALYICNKP